MRPATALGVGMLIGAAMTRWLVKELPTLIDARRAVASLDYEAFLGYLDFVDRWGKPSTWNPDDDDLWDFPFSMN